MYYCYLGSPVGDLLLAGDEGALRLVGFPNGSMRRDPDADWIFNEMPFGEVRRQLKEYFAGQRKTFDLPLRLTGTEFQVRVLEELQRIPYGTDRPPEGGTCRRGGERPQPGPHHHPVPPGHRQPG